MTAIAVLQQQQGVGRILSGLEGLSALIGLTTAETMPVIVEALDRPSRQLVCYVPSLTPIQWQVIDEIRIPMARIAWATAFVEDIDAGFGDYWGYSNCQSGLALAIADAYGFPIRRRKETPPPFKPFPTGFPPPKHRCVELRSGIPLYFDWNWLDRVQLLNQRIDEHTTDLSVARGLVPDGVGLLSFCGWVCFLEPASVHEIEGAEWEVAALTEAPEAVEPTAPGGWLPVLFRRDRYMYPRQLWRSVRNPFCLCGELMPFNQDSRWGPTEVALKVRAGAFRSDRRPAFPFAGSINDYIVEKIRSRFTENPPLADMELTSATTGQQVIGRLGPWLRSELSDLGHHAFPLVTDNMRDSGVDLLVELPNSRCRIGFQVKSPAELARARRGESLEAVVMRQLQQSRQYGLYRMFLVLAADPRDRGALGRARGIISSIGKMDDPYVVVVPPEVLTR